MGRFAARRAVGARAALVLGIGLSLVLSACVADEPEVTAASLVDESTTMVVANAPGTLSINGDQRVLVALIGAGPNEFLGDPDTPATLEFESMDGDASGEADGEWISSPGVALGLYQTSFTFAEAGQWRVALKGADELPGALVQVVEDSIVPEPGDPAPPSITLTGTSADELAVISTDPEPEAGFYDLSIDEAVTNGRPTVIAFATPAFCQTAICGPTVELLKDVADGRDDIDFVHVEPFDIDQARAGSLAPIAPMLDWGLVTEPWVFIVDDAGIITASFEGIVGRDELERAVGNL